MVYDYKNDNWDKKDYPDWQDRLDKTTDRWLKILTTDTTDAPLNGALRSGNHFSPIGHLCNMLEPDGWLSNRRHVLVDVYSEPDPCPNRSRMTDEEMGRAGVVFAYTNMDSRRARYMAETDTWWAGEDNRPTRGWGSHDSAAVYIEYFGGFDPNNESGGSFHSDA